MKHLKKHNPITLICICILLSISLNLHAQLNNTLDPGSLGGGGNGFGNTNNPPIDPLNPPVDPLDPQLDPTSDPGGPTDPPDDIPLDGGVVILLAVGIASGLRKVKSSTQL